MGHHTKKKEQKKEDKKEEKSDSSHFPSALKFASR